jgi:hypothetical protein
MSLKAAPSVSSTSAASSRALGCVIEFEAIA